MAERLCQMLTWSRCGKSPSDLLKGRIIAGEGNYTKRLCHSLTNRSPLLPAPTHTQTNTQVKVSSLTAITTVKRFTMILQSVVLKTKWKKCEDTFFFEKFIFLKRKDSVLQNISPSLHVTLCVSAFIGFCHTILIYTHGVYQMFTKQFWRGVLHVRDRE